jgi:hypothetical protein
MRLAGSEGIRASRFTLLSATEISEEACQFISNGIRERRIPCRKGSSLYRLIGMELEVH